MPQKSTEANQSRLVVWREKVFVETRILIAAGSGLFALGSLFGAGVYKGIQAGKAAAAAKAETRVAEKEAAK